MKFIKSNKAYTLTELLITLLILSIVSAAITQVLIFIISSTRSFSEYNGQQFTLQDAYQRLNKDIEASTKLVYYYSDPTTIKLTVDGVDKEWKIDNGKLQLNGNVITDQLTTDSCFRYVQNHLVVVLEAKRSEYGKAPINVSAPIVAQYYYTENNKLVEIY